MPPKVNSKAAAGRARKAEAADKKAAAETAKAEAAEAASWEKGAKGKSAADVKAEKAAEAARKKAEKERLLAEEEANTPSAKPSKAKAAGGSGGGKKSGGGGGGGGGGSSKKDAMPEGTGLDAAVSSFAASNIDDALDAMTLATEKTDKATVGSKAAELERHPERRFKAAFEAFKEREMPRVREERPGLRQQQYHEVLYKEFQKHPDNPFNQVTVAYDASKAEKVAALQAHRDATAKRLAAE